MLRLFVLFYLLNAITSCSQEQNGTPVSPVVPQDIKVSKIEINVPSCNLIVGGASAALKATVYPENATDTSVYWYSANSNVAFVTRFGVVIPKSAGTTTVTVSSKDGSQQATCIITVALVNEMVALPAGTFSMGQVYVLGAEPVHQVKLSAFNISRYEITQKEYLSAMGNNPSKFTGNENRPVEEVSWFDAVLYCNARSKGEGKDTVYRYTKAEYRYASKQTCSELVGLTIDYSKNGYRLPTEAEWEYACRAGTTGDYYGELADIAWFYGLSGDSTHQVGEKMPNSFGLYDMTGNVNEWCNNYNYNYSDTLATNPTGGVSGSNRAYRGGYYSSLWSRLYSAYRSFFYPSGQADWLGFRVVCTP